MTFEEELKALINRHSMEGYSNTPDFILANYLWNCMEAYGAAVRWRDQWYGARTPSPSAEKNAERYCWLKANEHSELATELCLEIPSEDWDAAIDAAMAAKK